MKYVIEKNIKKEGKPVGYILWEETDFPKKELLKHPVPANYKGTSESKYLLELFELSWSNGEYIPKGYLPLFNRLPHDELEPNSEYEITSFKDLDYPTANYLIFTSVFNRFGIKYYNTLEDDVFSKIDKLGIPFLAHKELVPQDIDSVYYFALFFKHELFNKISHTGIVEILKNSENKSYPKDSNGYLDILSLIKFSKSFTNTEWTISPNSEKINNEWNPHIVAPQHWNEFYQLYIKYGDKGFIEISKSIELRDIKSLMRMAQLFEIHDYKELLETYNNVPQEWLEKISVEEN